MGRTAYGNVYIGFEILESSIWDLSTPVTWVCQKGHVRSGGIDPFCPKDGTPFKLTRHQALAAPMMKLAKMKEWDPSNPDALIDSCFDDDVEGLVKTDRDENRYARLIYGRKLMSASTYNRERPYTSLKATQGMFEDMTEIRDAMGLADREVLMWLITNLS